MPLTPRPRLRLSTKQVDRLAVREEPSVAALLRDCGDAVRSASQSAASVGLQGLQAAAAQVRALTNLRTNQRSN